MVSVVASVYAQQTESGGSLTGLLQAPLPGLGESTWISSTKLGFSYNVVGEDTSAVYVRRSSDSIGSTDSDVYRIAVADGTETQLSGAAVSIFIGNTYLVLPLGDLDAVLFGRDAIVRVQGDEVLWGVELTGQDGFIMADAAAVSGGSITVIYQKADFSNFRAINYKAFTFSATSPPSSTDMTGWDTYPIDWDAIAGGTGVAPLSSAVLAAVAPTLDYGIAVQQVRGGDGWFQDGRYVLTGVFEDGGLPTVSHYGNIDVGMGNKLSQITTNVDIAGGEIVGAMVAQTPLASSTTDIPLPPLEPGYDTWTVSEFFGFGVSFDPPAETPPFWTNLRRAAEQI